MAKRSTRRRSTGPAKRPTPGKATAVAERPQPGTGTIPAIGFGWADRVDADWARKEIDAAVQLGRNEWRGTSSLQARVVQIKPAD